MFGTIIGIKIKPAAAGKKPEPEVFYCGTDGAKFRETHAQLVKENKDGTRFFRCLNPTLIPLASVPTNTEDHPDHIEAQKHRAKTAAVEKQKSLSPEESAREELMGKSKSELSGVLEQLNADRSEKITPAGGKKSDLVDAILSAQKPAETTETNP